MKRQTAIAIAVGFLLLIGLALLSQIPVYTLRGYHCDYTGSMKSWVSLPLGIEINYKYEESALEEFIKSKFPNELNHRWISTAGTEKNIFGQAVLFGHGSPNALFGFPRPFLNKFVSEKPEAEVKQFYDMLLRNDSNEIAREVLRMQTQARDQARDRSLSRNLQRTQN